MRFIAEINARLARADQHRLAQKIRNARPIFQPIFFQESHMLLFDSSVCCFHDFRCRSVGRSGRKKDLAKFRGRGRPPGHQHGWQIPPVDELKYTRLVVKGKVHPPRQGHHDPRHLFDRSTRSPKTIDVILEDAKLEDKILASIASKANSKKLFRTSGKKTKDFPSDGADIQFVWQPQLKRDSLLRTCAFPHNRKAFAVNTPALHHQSRHRQHRRALARFATGHSQTTDNTKPG